MVNWHSLLRQRTAGAGVVGASCGVGAGEGFGSYTMAVPDDPILIGQSLYTQWFVFDAGSPVRFSATEAVELTWY